MSGSDSKKLGELHHGVCTDPTGACPRSYIRGQGIDWTFTQWFSGQSLPGGGGAGPRSMDLEIKCRSLYQGHPTTEGFCGSCGSPLAFDSAKPSLGRCPGCHREYHEGDLNQNFCVECGKPVEIEEEARVVAARHRDIKKLLGILPSLKEHGYVATHYQMEK